MALQLRANFTTIRNPVFLHRFSSSSSNSNDKETPKGSSHGEEANKSSSSSSYFSDIKASLRNPPSPRRNLQSPPPPPPPKEPPLNEESPLKPSRLGSIDEIRRNLSQYSRRSAENQSSSSSPSSPAISFQELYKRNVIAKGDESNNINNNTNNNKGVRHSFDAIRESLNQLRKQNQNQSQNQRGTGPATDRPNSKVLDPFSLRTLTENFKLKPNDSSGKSSNFVFGGTESSLPRSVFGKETGPKSESDSQGKTEFVKIYKYDELGRRLRELRPPDVKGGFSLAELNERLRKLRENEEKEMDSRIPGVSFKDLRESLLKLRTQEDEKTKKSTYQKLDILGQLGGAQNFMLAPPKQHLVEKYFHPDNLSSEEKLKLELQKVRDEFKMSESDCGSSRVQVAQLTTKIKHLSSVLHKKDKHSRKGLIAMVQKRKKLLKYLRRTDWDSYCLVISKLGLRDNPDYKH